MGPHGYVGIYGNYTCIIVVLGQSSYSGAGCLWAFIGFDSLHYCKPSQLYHQFICALSNAFNLLDVRLQTESCPGCDSFVIGGIVLIFYSHMYWAQRVCHAQICFSKLKFGLFTEFYLENFWRLLIQSCPLCSSFVIG